MELIPIVDASTLEMKGFAERRWAHNAGLCHLTTLLIPVCCDDPQRKVAVQTRLPQATFAGYRDFFGGHISLDKEFWPFVIGGQFSLKSIVWSAAIREANEELRMTNAKCHPVIVSRRHLRLVGQIGDFAWSGPTNVERSTLFLVKIPSRCSIHPMDDPKGRFVPVPTAFHLLDDVLAHYTSGTWQFADGAERILQRLTTSATLLGKVRSAIANIC